MRDSAIGLIVIGQTPRPSLTKELLRGRAPDRQIVQIGALDGLSRAEIAAAGPKSDKDTLFTTLPDGTDVKVSKQEIIRRVDHCLAELEGRGVSVAVLCCSGAFPGFESRVRLIEPSRVLSGLADAVLPKGRLGLLVPLAEQVEHIARKWRRDGVEVMGEAVAPGSKQEAVKAAAEALAAKAPDLIVMDCMAYTSAERAVVRTVFDGPILMAMSAAGRVVEELSD